MNTSPSALRADHVPSLSYFPEQSGLAPHHTSPRPPSRHSGMPSAIEMREPPVDQPVDLESGEAAPNQATDQPNDQATHLSTNPSVPQASLAQSVCMSTLALLGYSACLLGGALLGGYLCQRSVEPKIDDWIMKNRLNSEQSEQFHNQAIRFSRMKGAGLGLALGAVAALVLEYLFSKCTNHSSVERTRCEKSLAKTLSHLGIIAALPVATAGFTLTSSLSDAETVDPDFRSNTLPVVIMGSVALPYLCWFVVYFTVCKNLDRDTEHFT